MAVTLRYFTEISKPAFQHITTSARIQLIDHQSLQKIAGKNAKFAQNLPENCAENERKLRAICASCAH